MISIFSSLLLFYDGQAHDNYKQQMVYNSALFSICFMIFLGFTDDTLELIWRYKLILPTIASFPLLTAYSGSTSIYVPQRLQSMLMADHVITSVGEFLSSLGIIVDTQANGAIVELGYYFYIYMSLLSVFCTNAINIYAGINGLECGQSYIIACSILFFKLYEIISLQQLHTHSTLWHWNWPPLSELWFHISNNNLNVNENQIFTIIMVIPFIAVMLSLLRSNWYPARVFVGDTFCYFAGMTFAVLGIHGHFSKTLLLLFLPQIVNFVYSIPQLFKLIPCPRHRLPRINVETKLMYYSAFPCQAHEYKMYKVRANDTECPNCTLICLVLRFTGPLHEKTLCTVLLTIQILTSVLIFFLRYSVFENK